MFYLLFEQPRDLSTAKPKVNEVFICATNATKDYLVSIIRQAFGGTHKRVFIAGVIWGPIDSEQYSFECSNHSYR